jgi:hypothetical protein
LDSPIQGFIYVQQDEAGPTKPAAPGAVLRCPERKPPWIVVDHSLRSVIVTQWPGRLWQAEVLEKADEQFDLQVDATRAVVVKVIRELPVSELFGPQGEAVCAIIRKAEALTLDEVEALARADLAEAAAAYMRSWNRWIASVELGNGLSSPINRGFSIISEVVAKRARHLGGEQAYFVDDEGESHYAPEWSATMSALLHAAMAYGAPEYVTAEDAKILKSAWIKVFGDLTDG